MRYRFAFAALATLVAAGAFAQSAPPFFPGMVPTAAQWQSYFAAKFDATAGIATNPTLNGGTINNATSMSTAALTISATGASALISLNSVGGSGRNWQVISNAGGLFSLYDVTGATTPMSVNSAGLVTASGGFSGGTVVASTSVATPLYTTSAAPLLAQPPSRSGFGGVTGYASTASGGDVTLGGNGGDLTLAGGSNARASFPAGSSLILQGAQLGTGNSTATLSTGGGGAGNFNVSAGTLALTGAMTVSGTTTLSGVLTAPGYRSSGTIAQSGTTIVNTNSFAHLTPTFTGSMGGSIQGYGPLYIAPNETVNYYGSNAWNTAFITNSLGGAGAAGDRVGLFAQLTRAAASDPGDPGDRVDTALHTRGTAAVNNGGRQMGALDDGSSTAGAVFGATVQTSLTGTATFYTGVNGLEVDAALSANSSSRTKLGVHVALNDTDVNRGALSDVGLLFSIQAGGVSPGWQTLIGFGRETGDTASAADSTLIKTIERRYGGVNTVPMLRGVDFSEATITAGGFSFLSPNFAVDDVGAVYGAGITTNNIVRAQTATVTSVTVASGGEYLLDAATKPTFTVKAPPSGGTTATITTNAMVGVNVRLFGSTGKNYLVGDVLTVPSVAGTNPTVTVATVDAQGGIQTVTVTTNGAVTKAQANPALLAGGTGTGANFYIGYTTSTNTFVPSTFSPAATGAGHVVADVLTIVGDTGTATKFNVATVDAFGGVKTVTLNTAGAITVIGGTAIGSYNYHTATTTGAGTGGRFGVTYAVSTTTITNAGAGYLPKAPPYVRSSQALFVTASLTPVLTAAAATLALNPTGGAVTVGGASITPALSGTSASLGGGPLIAGACTSGTVSITGATTGMAVAATPVTYPGDGIYWLGYTSAANTITVKVCAAVAATPTASTYNVRVLQ